MFIQFYFHFSSHSSNLTTLKSNQEYWESANAVGQSLSDFSRSIPNLSQNSYKEKCDMAILTWDTYAVISKWHGCLRTFSFCKQVALSVLCPSVPRKPLLRRKSIVWRKAFDVRFCSVRKFVKFKQTLNNSMAVGNEKV